LEYWIEQWVGVYNHWLSVTDEYANHVLPVSYEVLCADSDVCFGGICEFLNVKKLPTATFSARVSEVPAPPVGESVDEAYEVYAALRSRMQQRMNCQLSA
jgi:hypothetical protein